MEDHEGDDDRLRGGAVTVAPDMRVTKEQLQQGWMELVGIRPIHHSFLVLRALEDGTYIVRNPEFKKR